MQIRKGPRSLGMTGLSNVSSDLDRPPGPLWTGREAPLGGRPAKGHSVRHLKFLCPNSKHLKFFHQKLTPIKRRLP
jgi:hypothetical protein